MAAIRSSGASQSTIKLVATNLIANGKLDGKVSISFHCIRVRSKNRTTCSELLKTALNVQCFAANIVQCCQQYCSALLSLN